jgi:dipeptidase E
MDDGRRIFAIGGHDFDRTAGNEALCDYMLGLTVSDHPSVCLLPTASGDPEDQIMRFRRLVGERDCDLSVVSLFRLGAKPMDLAHHLLKQDLIYVGGGSLVNLLAIWRAHGIDAILREAWDEGIVLCGQSAGAMCWFESGVTTSSGLPEIAASLGFLAGSACVHYGSEPARRQYYLEAVAGGVPGGFGLDDQAGVLFKGSELAEAVTARPGARVRTVGLDFGEVVEQPLPARQLEDPRLPIDAASADVIELRQTLAARAATRRSRGSLRDR